MMGTILGLLFGLLLLLLVGHALWGPLRFLILIGLRLLLGGLVLFCVNFCLSFCGLNIGINLLSALTVGILGFPGLMLLGALSLFY